MKKILFFIQDGVGGAERMSLLIGKSLDKEIFEVSFCLTGQKSSSSIVDFIPEGYHIIRIPNRNPLQLTWRIVSTIIREKPYAVFSSVINLNNKLLPFRFLYPAVKIIIRCDNYLYSYTEKQQKMIANFYPKANCIIAQTSEMRNELVNQLGIDATKVVVLQNPIDKQTIDKKVRGMASPFQDSSNKHFVAVGRFNKQKGFDLLIDAFLEVYKKKTDIDLYIVGDNTLQDGSIYSDIIQKAKDNGVEELIHCVGYKDNPYIYLKNADCFVLSSRWEGLPNVLIEALYLGTPVAAFKCIPVVERIVKEGINGFLAGKENIYELADAMLNASKLGEVESSYQSATIDDFVKLF